MSAAIKVVCTGAGNHAQSLLGVLVDHREDYGDGFDGSSLLSLADDLTGKMGDDIRTMVTEAKAWPAGIYYQQARTRLTHKGARRTEHSQTKLVERADGGRTFHFICPRCRKQGQHPRHVQLRDDSAARLFDTRVDKFDISAP